MSIDKTLYDRLGGKATLERVHKTFYDMAYAHPWLKLYFTDKPQQALEEQQTDFMSYLIGGPNRYRLRIHVPGQKCFDIVNTGSLGKRLKNMTKVSVGF